MDELVIIARLAPVLMMIVVLVFNHGIGRWRTVARAGRDAERLRLALRAELTTLLDICESNLRGIGDRTTLLLSSRAAAAVYRGSIQRLVSLTDEEIPPVVAAFAWNDAGEALLSAAARGHGAPAQRAEAERAALQAVKAHHIEGVRRINVALAALASAAEPARQAADRDTSRAVPTQNGAIPATARQA